MSEVVVIPLRVTEDAVRAFSAIRAGVWIVPDFFIMPAAVQARVVRYSSAADVRFQIPELTASYRAAQEIARLEAVGGFTVVHGPRAGGILYHPGRKELRVEFEVHGSGTAFVEPWIDRARAILLHMEREQCRAGRTAATAVRDITVSAVIPVFNLHRYLPQTLESLRRQTRTVDEILIIDDGSTDPETVTALRQLERDGVQVLWKPHSGLAATRNHGIQAATSSHILTLDADDCIQPAFVEAAIREFAGNDALNLVTSMVSCFSGRVDEVCGGWCPLGFDRDLLTVFNFASCATAIMPRRVLLDAGGYDETFAAYEDWELYCRLARRGDAAVIPEFLIDVRIRPDSMLRTLPRIMHETLRARILSKHANLAEDAGFALRLLQGEYVEFHRGAVSDPATEARDLVQSQLRYRMADRVNESLKKLGVQKVLKRAGEEWSQRM